MASKQAACLNCRRSKIKCKRDHGISRCEKCLHTGVECVVPGDFHVGRQKGVRKYASSHCFFATAHLKSSKRTGLEKAIHQIEEAVKKSKSDPSSSNDAIEHLQQLLREAQGDRPASSSTPATNHTPLVPERDDPAQSGDEQLALDDAENPLQLLARASDLRLASPQLPISTFTPFTTHSGSETGEQSDFLRFFLPMKASLDQGPHLDPIDLGLVTMEEAELLMSL